MSVRLSVHQTRDSRLDNVLHDTAPRYLGPLDRVTRRSAGTPLCQLQSPGGADVPTVYTVGSLTFNVSGPPIWNGLPEDVVSAPIFSSFRRRLKLFLFQKSYPDIVI